MDVLKKQMEGMEANILETLSNQQQEIQTSLPDVVKDLNAWRDKIEVDLSDLKEGQISMEARMSNVEGKLSHDSIEDTLLQEVREEFIEQKQRLIRMCIILMGVPESTEGLNVAAQLMKTIVPGWVGPLQENRIVEQKSQALKNCSKLTDRTEFKTISVRKDLRREEQAQWKEQSTGRTAKDSGATSAARMGTRLSKWHNDGELDSQQPKIHRVEAAMELSSSYA
ncbi:hypothetical protein Fcan01_26846 [Folsomia candida]|uniref:Uncharacterized protein n=1 Tax=Folsomia candida TaxID=158441 RepID=A0A226CYR4_FOLCA|nr:hypothetical protein Fcan01_26846 [Folsomia candida]